MCWIITLIVQSGISQQAPCLSLLCTRSFRLVPDMQACSCRKFWNLTSAQEWQTRCLLGYATLDNQSDYPAHCWWVGDASVETMSLRAMEAQFGMKSMSSCLLPSFPICHADAMCRWVMVKHICERFLHTVLHTVFHPLSCPAHPTDQWVNQLVCAKNAIIFQD